MAVLRGRSLGRHPPRDRHEAGTSDLRRPCYFSLALGRRSARSRSAKARRRGTWALARYRPCIHEAVLQLDRPVAPVLKALAGRGILGGLDLGAYYPELGPALLVCATETRTSADIDRYRIALGEALQSARAA